MDYDSWDAITDPNLKQAIDLMLHHFITVASKSDDPESYLDRLKVDWMTIYKI
jgi:hypothetical protein